MAKTPVICRFFGRMACGADEVKLSTLMKGRTYRLRVDSFNENGITEGDLIKMEEKP